MKRKITGIVGAVLLAIVGTVALVAYVQSAKDEAVAGERQVDVYVVDGNIARGAPLDDVRGRVRRTNIPAKVRPEDAITDLDGLDANLVAGVDLHEGEILLRSRLIDAEDLTRAEVPDGLQELSVQLDPERAVGGVVRAGDTVGVVVSYEPFDRPDGGQTANITHLVFHKVLVTAVQFDQNDSGNERQTVVGARDTNDGQEGDAVEQAPSNQLIVTLALSSRQVEQLVFAAEFGHIWLTAEPNDADESGTRIVTLPEAVGAAEVPAG